MSSRGSHEGLGRFVDEGGRRRVLGDGGGGKPFVGGSSSMMILLKSGERYVVGSATNGNLSWSVGSHELRSPGTGAISGCFLFFPLDR